MTASGGKGDPDWNRIVRVDTAGAVTEFHTPTPKSRPSGIVTGPDGALWFSESGAGKIGRLTPDGDFTEYPLPGPVSSPGPIAVSEGSLWVIGSNTGLALVSTAGEVRELALPPAREGPRGIAAAPGGGVWLAEFGRHAIARVDAAGTVVEYPLPRATIADPEQIAVDPGGGVWLLGSYGLVMRMAPDGRFTQFEPQNRRGDCGSRPCPPGLEPLDLTSGPDGKIWILARRGRSEGAVVRIDPGSPPPVPAVRIRPKLTGTARVGVRLVVDLGAWAQSPTEFSVRWRLCDRRGRDCRGLRGHEESLVLDHETIGRRIVAEVGASNRAGTTFLATKPSPVVKPPPSALRVALGAGRARLDARGRARIALACSGGPPGGYCSGRIALRAARGGELLGGGRYRLASGRSRAVAVPLTAPAAAEVERRGRLAASVRITLWGGKPAAGRLLLRG
jgi:virginiamycin B lyase